MQLGSRNDVLSEHGLIQTYLEVKTEANRKIIALIVCCKWSLWV